MEPKKSGFGGSCVGFGLLPKEVMARRSVRVAMKWVKWPKQLHASSTEKVLALWSKGQ